MIYFDSAATSMQKPKAVYDAVLNAMHSCASLGRSGHEAALLASETAYQCRCTAAELFDTEPEKVVFTFNATHGLNIAIKTLVQPGDRVVISGFEHNAVVRPLHAIGAEVHIAGTALFDEHKMIEAFRREVIPGTKAVICTHVSNVFGYILPVAEIAEICRVQQVPLVIDAAQSAGILPVRMRALNAAFVAMPGHKGLYGPQGTGLLLCGRMPVSLIEGGTGSLSQLPQMPEFLPDAAEAGTHNIPGIAGLLAGLKYIKKRGEDMISGHEKALLYRLIQRLQNSSAIKCFFKDKSQTGVLSVQIAGKDCETAAAELGKAGFAVRAGLHCAPLAHSSAGTLQQGTVRISFSDLNTADEVDALALRLEQISAGG